MGGVRRWRFRSHFRIKSPLFGLPLFPSVPVSLSLSMTVSLSVSVPLDVHPSVCLSLFFSLPACHRHTHTHTHTHTGTGTFRCPPVVTQFRNWHLIHRDEHDKLVSNWHANLPGFGQLWVAEDELYGSQVGKGASSPLINAPEATEVVEPCVLGELLQRETPGGWMSASIAASGLTRSNAPAMPASVA